jgi:hypothetical protein
VFIAAAANLPVARSAPRPASTAKGRGLEFAGLRKATTGPCSGLYEIATRARTPKCTHGPDPAPAGVDVTRIRSVADLTAASAVADTVGPAGVPCIGDGITGTRVQAIYTVASGLPDRFSTIAPLIAGWGGGMDSAVNQSAAETGGERHLRFVTNSDCTLNVAHVVLSATGDDSFSNTVNELSALGFNRSDRKYLVWADANVYCGIGQMIPDDTPGATNLNNTTGEFARVDSGCWGRTDHLSELHETMHNLGAVQSGAPHASAAGHCTDESDAMCYQDAASVVMTYPCPAAHEYLLDCNHDDYFNTAPAAGTYLSQRWNVANSAFLSSAGLTGTTTTTLAPTTTASPTTTAVPPTTTKAPTTTVVTATTVPPTTTKAPTTTTTGVAPTTTKATTTTTTTSAPTTTTPSTTAAPTTTVATTVAPTTTPTTTAPAAPVSTSFSGTLTAKHPVASYSVAVGSGSTTNALQFAGTGKDKSLAALRLRLLDPNGAVLYDRSGPSVLQLATQPLARGSYTWEVSGSTSASFSLQVAYTP